MPQSLSHSFSSIRGGGGVGGGEWTEPSNRVMGGGGILMDLFLLDSDVCKQ